MMVGTGEKQLNNHLRLVF